MSYELVVDARANTGYAMVDLLSKITPDVGGIVYHYLGEKYGHRLDVDDVVQEVLFQVARDIASCEAKDWKEFMCWVFFICRNCTYKAVELIKLGKSPADKTQAIGDSWEAASNRTATPEQAALLREDMEAIMALAAEISSNGPRICELLAEGWTPNEIAAELGITATEVYGLRRSLKEAANRTGVYETRKSDAWAKPADAEAQDAAAWKSQVRTYKKFADQIHAAKTEGEAVKMFQYLDKQLAKMAPEKAKEMRDAIGYDQLIYRDQPELAVA